MIEQTFFMDLSGRDNECIMDLDLYVNTTGISVHEKKFTVNYPSGRNDCHLLYLCSGTLKVKAAGKSYVLIPGQLIVFSPNVPFYYSNKKDSLAEYMWINFTGCEAENIISKASIPFNFPYSVANPQYVFEAFETFFDEFRYRSFLHELSIFYKFVQIAVTLGRSRKGNTQKSADSLTNSMMYISMNYTKDITTEELAKIEHLSCAHFRRLFKEKTGMTPTQYITAMRIRYAEQMLLETNFSVKEIANKVGFHDQLYFSKVFSKRYGVSPTDFRRK